MVQPLSEEYRLAAKEWQRLDAAASLMEENKGAVLSQRMNELGDMPVSRAELTVKASKEWAAYISEMCRMRSEANLAKVKIEWVRMRFQEQMSKEANKRAEMKL